MLHKCHPRYSIAVVCHVDAGKTGEHLSKALSTLPYIGVKYVTSQMSKEKMYSAISGADIVWVKGDTPAHIKGGRFTLYSSNMKMAIPGARMINVKACAKLVLSPSGSSFRRKRDDYVKAYALSPLEAYTKHCNIMAPLTPDLNYPELNGICIPHAIDNKRISVWWKKEARFTVGAYVGQCDSKHVYTNLIPAVDRLKKEGYDIDVNITKGVSLSHNEFMRRMRYCTVYYEQVNPLGVYGRSGVEAMSLGVPVIVSINDTAISQSYPIENYGEPCLRAYDMETTYTLLKKCLDGEIDLEDVSRRSREYAVRVHSYESVAEMAKNHIIRKLIKYEA